MDPEREDTIVLFNIIINDGFTCHDYILQSSASLGHEEALPLATWLYPLGVAKSLQGRQDVTVAWTNHFMFLALDSDLWIAKGYAGLILLMSKGKQIWSRHQKHKSHDYYYINNIKDENKRIDPTEQCLILPPLPQINTAIFSPSP